LITVASTTESPEQIKADLVSAGFKVNDETTDVTGKTVEATPATPPTPAAETATTVATDPAAGQTAAELETATNHEPETTEAPAGTPDKTNKKLLKRIDKTTAKWRTEQSRREQLEAENAELRRKLAGGGEGVQAPKPPVEPAAPETATTAAEEPAAAAAPAAQEPAPPKRPRQADYADWDEYEAALDKHEQDLIQYHRTLAQAETRKQQEAEQANKQAQQANEQWATIATEGQKRYADWDAVKPQAGSENDVQFQAELGALIQVSKIAPDILYHLAKNPADARYIAGLPVPVAARELGRLEAYLEQNTAAPSRGAAPARSAAAPATPATARETITPKSTPISPVNTGTASLGASDPGQLTPREYRRRRMAGEIH